MKKYLFSLMYIFVPIIVIGFLLTIFYYFNLISTNIYTYLKLFIIIISLFLGGNYLGKNSKEKGWLQGIKLSFLIICSFFIINYLAFNNGFSFKILIYYLIIMITTVFGSMFGIRNVEKEKK